MIIMAYCTPHFPICKIVTVGAQVIFRQTQIILSWLPTFHSIPIKSSLNSYGWWLSIVKSCQVPLSEKSV